MVCVNSSVFISSTGTSKDNSMVVTFMRHPQLTGARLEKDASRRRKTRKVASEGLADGTTAYALVAQKDGTLLERYSQLVAREFLWGRRVVCSHLCLRGSFKVIALGTEDLLVALETSWQADQDRLARELEAYAAIGRFGVNEADPEELYACRGNESWSMERCRKAFEASPGHLFVELVDHGREQLVMMEQLLVLSAELKNWSVKAVDLDFQGFNIAHNSRGFLGKIKAYVLDKTFELHYLCERKGALTRDRLIVLGMKMNGEPVLGDLVEKGVFVRK